MNPEIIGSLGLVIGFFIGLFLRELARLLWGMFVTTYPAETFAQAEDIGDAGAGDTRIMVFEVTKRGKGPNK